MLFVKYVNKRVIFKCIKLSGYIWVFSAYISFSSLFFFCQQQSIKVLKISLHEE